MSTSMNIKILSINDLFEAKLLTHCSVGENTPLTNRCYRIWKWGVVRVRVRVRNSKCLCTLEL